MEDMAEHMVPSLGTLIPDYWAEAMLPQSTPLGRAIRRGPESRTFYEILALVAAGKSSARSMPTSPGTTLIRA